MTPVAAAAFRPRRARAVGLVIAAAFLLLMIGVSVALTFSPDAGWTVFDTISAVGFGLLISGGLTRLVSVRALPTADALLVRNVVYTTRVEWGAIVGVRFGGADPWLTLDLDDGENLAVMAVQRADGEHGRQEAHRLARLVESHNPAPRDR